MADVTRLLTFVYIDDRDARGLSVSALHQAVLDDGRRVVLLDDRGGTSSKGAAAAPVADIEETARVVVGPDEPFGDRCAPTWKSSTGRGSCEHFAKRE